MKYLVAWLFSIPAFAGTWIGPGKLTYEDLRSGSYLYPAAICPDIGKKYEDLAQKLISLKADIKKTANCPDEQVSIDEFSKIVKEKRDNFFSVIEKGRTQPLNQSESDTIKSYINELAAAGNVILDMAEDNRCFRDEKKNRLRLDVVSGLISEGTSAVSTVMGAYGPVVTLGGRITSSVIASIDKTIKSRRVYDFEEPEQRKAYIKSLCSYFSIRGELQEISNVDGAIEDLKNYQATIGEQVKLIQAACPECAILAKEYDSDYKKRLDYVWLSHPELREHFKERVDIIDAKYALPIGSSLIYDLRTLVWIADELLRLNQSISDIGDVERDRVINLQDSVEDFFFSKTFPTFINRHREQVKVRLKNINDFLYGYLFAIGEANVVVSPFGGPATIVPYKLSNTVLVERLYRNNRYERLPATKNAKIELNRMIGDLVSTLLTVQKSCHFALAASAKFNSTMFGACNSQNATMDEAWPFLWKVGHEDLNSSSVIKAVFEIPTFDLFAWSLRNHVDLEEKGVVWSANWIQALTAQQKKINSMADRYYVLKENWK